MHLCRETKQSLFLLTLCFNIKMCIFGFNNKPFCGEYSLSEIIKKTHEKILLTSWQIQYTNEY